MHPPPLLVLEFFLGLLIFSLPADCDPTKAIHFTLSRRGGQFAPNRTANLDFLVQELAAAESKFNLTQREVRGNKIVRSPKSQAVGGAENSKLLGELGRHGNWFATLRLGGARQPIDTDLDMLTADFAVTSTSSSVGTKFDELFSDSYIESYEHPFPSCSLPKDNIHLPTIHRPFPLSFPHCKPSRQSRDTLHSSGSILGLAPSSSLKQISVPSLIQQLLDSKLIDEHVFSVTLINGFEGVLSIGGTAAEAMTSISERIETFLGTSSPAPAAEQVVDADQDAMDLANGAPQNLLGLGGQVKRDVEDTPVPAPPNKERESGGPNHLLRRGLEALANPLVKRARKPKQMEQKAAPSWKDDWQWTPVEGAEGWWQTLMRGIWVDNAKVLKNQPCVIDVNTPFILAPPQAAKQFYQGISGSYRLPAPYSSFYAFPCNNPPFMHVEFGRWRFPIMRGMKSYDHSIGPNGKFSLGKVTDKGGYCIGAVVETRMGVGDQSPIKKGHSRKQDNLRGMGQLESGMLAGNGMRDVWVLGEPIFRGLGLVFDIKGKQVGVRTY